MDATSDRAKFWLCKSEMQSYVDELGYDQWVMNVVEAQCLKIRRTMEFKECKGLMYYPDPK